MNLQLMNLKISSNSISVDCFDVHPHRTTYSPSIIATNTSLPEIKETDKEREVKTD